MAENGDADSGFHIGEPAQNNNAAFFSLQSPRDNLTLSPFGFCCVHPSIPEKPDSSKKCIIVNMNGRNRTGWELIQHSNSL